MTEDLEPRIQSIVVKARERFERQMDRTRRNVDQLFVRLLLAEWLFAILVAVVFSPYGWSGKVRVVHMHVWIAVLLGGAIVSLPVLAAFTRPGSVVTRHLIATAQTLMSALLIHLSGGRIETHFHVFVSLAILAFYVDWTILITATVVVAGDHFVRGLLWPESVYGIVNPEWWRFLEHAFWVVFMVGFLTVACRRQIREWLGFAEEIGMTEALLAADRPPSGEAPP
jgi:hypothetical protein